MKDRSHLQYATLIKLLRWTSTCPVDDLIKEIESRLNDPQEGDAIMVNNGGHTGIVKRVIRYNCDEFGPQWGVIALLDDGLEYPLHDFEVEIIGFSTEEVQI